MSKSPLPSLENSIARLTHGANAIHIRSLRFPSYRSLEPNSRLPLEFPITVLLGRNGSNKSSILHALYGAAKDQRLGHFWFETEVDAIPPLCHGLKQSVTHTYIDADGNEVECIKARAPRGKKDPDYWEAVKPSQRYGFAKNAKRAAPIDLNVVHLDFRGELPAFDKYFNFPDPTHLARLSVYARERATLRRSYNKQDYLRQRSKRLKNLLAEEGVPLTAEELKILCYVLERDYKSGTLLQHKLYHGHEGSTILFKTGELNDGYSDAFAGSGESAATLLVHNILGTPDGSLVLLDEPETSLHPRAQQRLLEFVAHYSAKKSLQVVMATHSIYLAEKLPSSAIRVLERTRSGLVSISTSFSAREALHEIETSPAGKTLIVEDERAKTIVLAALEAFAPHALKEIYVAVRDGGTSRIFRDVLTYANSDSVQVFVMLDGDHRPESELPGDEDLPQGLAKLDELIDTVTKGPNKHGPELRFVDAAERTRFLKFSRANVRYLPGTTPERLLWSNDYAKQILALANKTAVPKEILDEADAKLQMRRLASEVPGMNEDGVFQLFLTQFIAQQSAERNALHEALRHIRDA